MNLSNTIKNIIFILVYILAGLALLLIIDGLTTGQELAPFNVAMGDLLRPLRTPVLTTVFLVITNVGSPVVLSIISCFLAIILVLHRDTYDALLYIVSIAIALFSFVILKNIFSLPRPEGGLIGLTGWSFPSGHATIATAFFFATAHSFFNWPKKSFNRFLLVLFSVVGAGLIALSRLYLGAHWALDVLAGICLGLMCVSFTALAFNIFLTERGLKIRRRKSMLN
jgi:undecaprenyl-diphosphatase